MSRNLVLLDLNTVFCMEIDIFMAARQGLSTVKTLIQNEMVSQVRFFFIFYFSKKLLKNCFAKQLLHKVMQVASDSFQSFAFCDCGMSLACLAVSVVLIVSDVHTLAHLFEDVCKRTREALPIVIPTSTFIKLPHAPVQDTPP